MSTTEQAEPQTRGNAPKSRTDRKRSTTTHKTAPKRSKNANPRKDPTRANEKVKAKRLGTASERNRAPRPDTKLARLIALLERKRGATIGDLMEATGWQAHSVRGALSGSLRKKFGHTISSEKVNGRGRVYRIIGQR